MKDQVGEFHNRLLRQHACERELTIVSRSSEEAKHSSGMDLQQEQLQIDQTYET